MSWKRSPKSSESPACALPDARWRGSVRRALLAWFDRHARALPWRQTRDPYAIWLSEVMLQQTQVATVIPYFERFLSELPTLADLAQATDQQVFRLWEGLGYYRRARQLHEAARRIVTEHGGAFPRSYDALRQLPGIGRYTAGAVLSQAFDLPLPILEANTIRVFSRLLAFEGNPHASAGQELLWSLAEAVLPKKHAGKLNQALMELGALVCVNHTPRCDDCPVARLCRARQLGRQDSIPRPKPKPVFEPKHEAAVLVRRGKSVLLCRRPPGVRWAGLWDFPRFEVAAENEGDVAAELVTHLQSKLGLKADLGHRLATLRHGVTRFRIVLDCFAARWRSGDPARRDPDNARWLPPADLADYPLSSTGRKLAALVE